MSKQMMLVRIGVTLMMVGGSVLHAQTWTGTASTDWATEGNWNTGSEPTTSSNVIIEEKPFNPVVSTAGVLRGLSLGEHALHGFGPTLTVADGGSLTFGGRGPNVYEATITVEAGGSFTAAWEFFLGGPVAGFEARTTLNIFGDVLQNPNPHQVRLGNHVAGKNGFATVNLEDGTFYVNDLIFDKNVAANGGTPDSHIFIRDGELRLPASFETNYDNDWINDEIQAVDGFSLMKNLPGDDFMYITSTSGGFKLPVNDFAWKGPDSGDWDTANLWTPSGGPPGTGSGFTNHSATFGDVIAAPKTVFRDTAVSVHGMLFNSGHGYAIAGQGSVTFVAGTQMGNVDLLLPDLRGDSSIDVVQGHHQFQLPVTLANDTTVDVASGQMLSFHNVLHLMGHTFTKTGEGTVAINNKLHNAAGSVNIRQGTVAGDGTVGGNVNNDGGTISPGNVNNDGSLSVVPEPASVVLCLLGLFGAASIFWRKRP